MSKCENLTEICWSCWHVAACFGDCCWCGGCWFGVDWAPGSFGGVSVGMDAVGVGSVVVVVVAIVCGFVDVVGVGVAASTLVPCFVVVS